MPTITWVQPDGSSQTYRVEKGISLMHAAVENGVDGIAAVCGGACACGTCLVSIDPAWSGHLPQPGVLEKSMIEYVDIGAENQRLSCQILVDDTLDGLVLHVPAL